MTTKCPHCTTEFDVQPGCVVPETQRMTLTLGYESEWICARSLGKSILSMEEIQRRVAKEIGIDVTVFVSSITLKPKEISVEFVIAKNLQRK